MTRTAGERQKAHLALPRPFTGVRVRQGRLRGAGVVLIARDSLLYQAGVPTIGKEKLQ